MKSVDMEKAGLVRYTVAKAIFKIFAAPESYKLHDSLSERRMFTKTSVLEVLKNAKPIRWYMEDAGIESVSEAIQGLLDYMVEEGMIEFVHNCPYRTKSKSVYKVTTLLWRRILNKWWME